MTDVADPSAVDLFGEWHDGAGASGMRAPGGGTAYRALLPATAPGPGQQYRFEVDLDSCTGCKACVAACHSLNGLDEDETWRSVGLLVGGTAAPPTTATVATPVAPWQQHVTTACHHCLEPACLAGCPVEAYEKDPITGIVSHLDDQCIGCRYCMLTCPYEVPSFNERLGVVRKCDMCKDRLAEGEEPACVQGCPTDAISIGLVSTVELQAGLAVDPSARLVPTAPRSAHTQPTTVYLTRRPTAPHNVVAADDHHVVPAHNHPPLVAMLVLTQMSVGAFVLSHLLDLSGVSEAAGSTASAVLSWVSALVAIGASVLHLGRPLVAWRAVLGLRHSWLSREIVAFGAYAPLGGATAAASAGWLPNGLTPWLATATALVGLAGVGCSAMLYAVTGRPYWRLDRTVARFVVTMAATGGAAVALADVAVAGGEHAAVAATWVATCGIAVGWMMTFVFVARHRGAAGPLGRSVSLLTGVLSPQMGLAFGASGVAVVIAGGASAGSPSPTAAVVLAAVALLAVLVAAWIERGLYFTGDSPDRMPGALR
ncbi:MAG TPA: dimethyl sulfoxide reductase anchor subunit [Microthrixaceae bacterium]|nr:dimethyl sulfoxide reductase anchor subunit [Microthrixaceae bacterium]HNI34450.1 dimethyl sulfoxide reductase anchor subunit [Microthrixaceae bacterium]